MIRISYKLWKPVSVSALRRGWEIGRAAKNLHR